MKNAVLSAPGNATRLRIPFINILMRYETPCNKHIIALFEKYLNNLKTYLAQLNI